MAIGGTAGASAPCDTSRSASPSARRETRRDHESGAPHAAVAVALLHLELRRIRIEGGLGDRAHAALVQATGRKPQLDLDHLAVPGLFRRIDEQRVGAGGQCGRRRGERLVQARAEPPGVLVELGDLLLGRTRAQIAAPERHEIARVRACHRRAP